MSEGAESSKVLDAHGQPSPPPEGHLEETATRTVDPWRQLVVSPWPWRHCTNQAGALVHTRGEAGGFFVTCEALGGCRAYLKPLSRATHAGQVRAAREKIVADLAHDLEVLVPPVLLYDRGTTQSGEEQHVCLSRVMFPRQWSWHQVKQIIAASDANDRATKIVMNALRVDPARAFALDAWVGQPDHNDHPHNIIFGYSPGVTPNGRFVFLDYAWSLGYHREEPFCWEGEAWKTIGSPPFPPYMVRFLDRKVLEECVQNIEATPDERITEVVERIPGHFLPADQRRMILAGLLGRKNLVREAVRQYLPHS